MAWVLSDQFNRNSFDLDINAATVVEITKNIQPPETFFHLVWYNYEHYINDKILDTTRFLLLYTIWETLAT